jgi:hypothetical protein
MRENSAPHFCDCLPCAQTGVLSGIVMQEEDLIHFLFGQTLQIHYFNVTVCTYHSELIVAPPRIPLTTFFPDPEDANRDFACRSLHLELFLVW